MTKGRLFVRLHGSAENAFSKPHHRRKIDRAGLGEAKNKSVYFFVFWETLSEVPCLNRPVLFPFGGEAHLEIFRYSLTSSPQTCDVFSST